MAERDKTEIEIAIEYVLKRLQKAESRSLIEELTRAFTHLMHAKNDEQEGHK